MKADLNQEQMLLQMQCVAIDLLNGHEPTEPLNLKIRDILLSFSRQAEAKAYQRCANWCEDFAASGTAHQQMQQWATNAATSSCAEPAAPCTDAVSMGVK